MINLKTDSAIFNIYKPAGITSYDVIRKLKKTFPEKPSKVGHFGTLDPFAEGVLLIGINRGTKLNDYVHKFCPKTYIAKGILGIETPSGDLTTDVSQVDEGKYLEKISHFDKDFIQETLRKKFLGEYWQAPHQFSAAKFEGKKLYEYAREGIEIKKEKKRKEIYKINVLDFSFPHLDIEFEVSSGTYIRTLFSDCARHLGTIGTLQNLIRSKVGSVHSNINAIPADFDKHMIDFKDILNLNCEVFDGENLKKLRNGNFVQASSNQLEGALSWGLDASGKISSLVKVDKKGLFRPVINF